MSIRLDRIPTLDRQTDGRTDGMICPNNIALCMHRMLTRDNKLRTVEFYNPITHSEIRL